MTELHSNNRSPVLLPATSFLHLPRPATTYSGLSGTRAIAKYVLGADDPASVRAMYNILGTSGTIPATKRGGIWQVDITALNSKLWSQERLAFPTAFEELLAQLHIVLDALLPFLAVCSVGTVHGEIALGDYVTEAITIINQLMHSKTL